MLVAIDTETELFGPANMAPSLVCVSMCYPDDRTALLTKEPGLDRIEEMLDNGTSFTVANAAYDFAVFAANRPRLTKKIFEAYEQNRVHCVLVRQKLIELALGRYGGSYSLAAVYGRWFDEKLEKEDTPRLEYHKMQGVPLKQWPQEFIDYAIDDAVAHMRVHKIQDEALVKRKCPQFLDDQFRQTRADFCLNLIRTWGLRTDPEGVEYLESKCLEKINTLRPRLLEAGILQEGTKKGETVFTLKKRPAQERMLEAHGGDFEQLYLTPKGFKEKKNNREWQKVEYISVKREACEYCPDSLLRDYAEYAANKNLLGGHIKAMKEGLRLPIHTRYQVLQETGRTGSSKPNVQNVRKAPGARECFVPREGNVFGAADYSSAELYTLAQTCLEVVGYSHMAEALNGGQCLHTRFGATLAGVGYEEATALLKDPDHSEEMGTWRQRAKAFNFGAPGGMGAKGLVAYARGYGQELSIEQASTYLKQHKETYSEVHALLEWVRRNNAVGNYEDRYYYVLHPMSNRRRGKATYCAAANSYFQGRAADGAKNAMFEIIKRQYTVPESDLYGTRTVNFVHDEFIIEAPRETAAEAVTELAQVMAEKFNEFVPDVPCKAEPVLMDRWSKAAKPVFDENGRLKVWEYKRQ